MSVIQMTFENGYPHVNQSGEWQKSENLEVLLCSKLSACLEDTRNQAV